VKPELLDMIVCPDCEGELELRDARWSHDEVESGRLVCADAGHDFAVRNFVPRFVESDDYADAFALEWNAFRTAHLDSYTGLNYLDDQLQDCLDFDLSALAGKVVLDAGCGLGRFTEVCLNHGARVIAVDLSGAVDAAFANLRERDGVFFIQADIFRLPFRRETFDFAYSWGVLHHTPDPPRAFAQLPPLVKPGGKVMAFVYASYNKAYLATTELYRKLTTRLPQRLLLKLCYLAVPLYYVSKIPVIGPFITRLLIPVSVRPPTHRWRVGNTFDLYSPKYAFTYDHVEVHEWFRGAGLTSVTPVAPDSGVTFIGTVPVVDEDEEIDWSAAEVLAVAPGRES
jgi:SAM-dependent methyltransferase